VEPQAEPVHGSGGVAEHDHGGAGVQMAWNYGECSTGWRGAMRLGSGWSWLLLGEEDYGSSWGKEVADSMATESGREKRWRA
jgi:hypothetical protein